MAAGGHMAGQRGPARRVPSGAIALLAGAISYALGACAQVAPGEMALPTPCADWDLAALLAHLAASMADLETGHPHRLASTWTPSAGPRPARRPGRGAARPGREPLCACYGHHGPERFVPVGGLPLAAGIVACTGAVEIAVHGWDVSAARGRGALESRPAWLTRMLAAVPAARGGPRGPVRRPGRRCRPGQPGRPARRLSRPRSPSPDRPAPPSRGPEHCRHDLQLVTGE